jgi:hypothetical protein
MSQLVIRQASPLPAPSPAAVGRAALGALAALLLYCWSPAAPETPVATPAASRPRLNVDPISGKLLDRIEGAAPPASDAPAQMLTRYGFFNIAGVDEPPMATAPVQRKSAAVKPPRAAPPKTDAAGRKPAPTAKSAAPEPAAEAPREPQSRENENGWSRWSPDALAARAPAMGRDLAKSVVAGAGSASRALIDRLPAPGL